MTKQKWSRHQEKRKESRRKDNPLLSVTQLTSTRSTPSSFMSMRESQQGKEWRTKREEKGNELERKDGHPSK